MSKLHLLASFLFVISLSAHAAETVHRLAQNTPTDENSIEKEIDSESDSLDDQPTTPPPSTSSDAPEELTPPPSDETPTPPPPTKTVEEESERPSSSSGDVTYDWSKYHGEPEIAHPNAAKGLIRITRDRTYIYKVQASEQKHAAAFHVGMFDPPNLRNPDAPDGTAATFDDNYQTSSPAFLFDYEWQPWQTAIGKIGLQLGTGAIIAQGNGHFVHINQDKTPLEVFTFAAIPLSAGAVYRMQLWHQQLIVPYAAGGGTAYAFGEFRDDNKAPKFGGTLAAYYAGGAALNLTYFDALSRLALDREYGINAVYLTVEYRKIVALTTRYDFSSDLLNAGFLMEY